MSLRNTRNNDVPTRVLNLEELLLRIADILGNPDISAYMFGSRKDRTGSIRSDVDILIPVDRSISQAQAIEIWELEPYLDIFQLSRGIAKSLVNESEIRAASDIELFSKLGAEPLTIDGSWSDSADCLKLQTVLGERNPAATIVPMYELTDAVPAERADILVMTALTEEYHAVLNALGVRASGEPSVSAELLDDKNSPWRIRIVNMHEMGSVGSALKTQEALMRTKAQHVVLVGICAGIPERSRLLDVVIPASVIYYEPSKVRDGGDSPGYASIPCNPLVRSRIESFENLFEGQEEHPQILVKDEVMACGEKVVSSVEFRTQLAGQHRKLAAIDMESYGVIRASQAFKRDVTVIKSVCDLADAAKSDVAHDGARNAAALTLKKCIERGVFRTV